MGLADAQYVQRHLVLIVLIVCGACSHHAGDGIQQSQPTRTMLEEASMNFDGENVRPFLKRLKPLVESGFADGEIAQVVQMLERLQIDEEREMEFSIRYRGKPTVLRIQIFMDDVNAPDVAFFTDPELAKEIDSAMEQFAAELGI